MTVQKRQAQRGFILPLTLALLIALAFLITVAIEQAESARSRATAFTDVALDGFEQHAIEQDLVYHALLDLHGRVYSGLGETFTYQGAQPSTEWNTNSQTFVWQKLFAERSPETADYIVRIQDTSGLFDVNYTDQSYLNFMADYLGVPASQRRRAIRHLIETIDALSWAGDARRPRSDGFSSPSSICSQDIWSDIDLCKRPDEMSLLFTAREGRLPNFRTMPDSVKEIVVPDFKRLSEVEALRAWERFRTDRNIGGILESYGGDRTNFIVTIARPNDAFQRRYMLNVLYDRLGRPYSIKQRKIEPRNSQFGVPQELE